MATNKGEIGAPGLAEFSGIIQDEFLKELRGKDGYKRYDEMRRNSAPIGAMLLAIEQSIRGVSWEFHSDEGEDDERLEFLNESKEGMSHSWNDHLIEALTFLPFGFSLFEIVYKQDERKRWMWRKFAFRGQDTVHQWLFDEKGGLAGFRQLAPPRYNFVDIPVEKMLLYRTRVERNNPEGRSILRNAWINYYYAKHIQQIEAIGIERNLAGLPVITLPPGADTADSDTSDYGVARKVVRNVRNDEQAGIVLASPDWKFELLSASGSGKTVDTDRVITRHKSEMLMSALAQFLLLGQQNVGSLALSKDQTDFFNMSVNSTADIIAETFTKYAIPRLLKVNGYDPDGIRLEHTPAGDIDVNAVADFLQKTGSMITWNAQDELWLRQLARLPERDVEEIEAEREAKRAIAQQIQRSAQDNNPFNRQDGEQEDDKQELTVFAADAPDDATRRQFERKLARALKPFLEKQKKRIMREAKNANR